MKSATSMRCDVIMEHLASANDSSAADFFCGEN